MEQIGGLLVKRVHKVSLFQKRHTIYFEKLFFLGALHV